MNEQGKLFEHPHDYHAKEPYGFDFSISIETRGKLNMLKSTKSDEALNNFLYSLNQDLENHYGKSSDREAYIPYVKLGKKPLE